MVITSRSNEAVKRARSLATAKGRAELGCHIIEGPKLLTEAIASCMQLVEGFVEEGNELYEAILVGSGAVVHTVSREVLEAVTQTQTPQTVCAMVQTPSTAMPDAFPEGMLVALDAVQDPGNLGTILRTADAMGAAAVLLSDGCADPYSPKAIRAAMGSTYHLPVYKGNINAALQQLKNDGYICICGHLQGQEALPDPTGRCVIVIGNEGNGVAEENAALCALYRLPMFGRAESLNASVAAGILMYEVARAMHQS